MRIERGCLSEVPGWAKGAVHFVGGDLKIPNTFTISFPAGPGTLCSIKQREGSKNVCRHKCISGSNGTVNMALCRKVNDIIYLVITKDPVDQLFIADVTFDKSVIYTIRNICKIFRIPCIGELVKIENTDLFTVLPEHVVDEVGSDKAASTGYEIGFHKDFVPFSSRRERMY